MWPEAGGCWLDSIIANPSIQNHQGAQIKIVVVDAGQDAEVDIFTSFTRDAWKFDPVR